uniref:Capsid protein n=1 Tax=viral metagenome TaxID=1070528 RepID=A0A2V0RIE0_9ZZZZ
MANKNIPGFVGPILPGKGKAKLAISPQTPTLNALQPGTSTRVADITLKASNRSQTGNKSAGKVTKKGKQTRNMDVPPKYTAPEFSDSSSSSSSSDSFQQDSKRTIFYDENRDLPISFDLDLLDTTTPVALAPVEMDYSSSSGNNDSRFIINIAQYARNFNGQACSTAGYPVYDHYVILYNQMVKKVYAVVRSKIVDAFTFANFYNYIQLMTAALELFYTTDAILSYTSTKEEKNTGVMQLQRKLTEIDLFTSQNELRRLLKGYWFPEKFSKLIRWTYQIYKTSDLDQACNYMFIPNEVYFYTSSSMDVATAIKAQTDHIIGELTTGTSASNYVKIVSVLGQVYPEGLIEGLPFSTNRATYDPQHYEVFTNQPVLYKDDTTDKVYPFSTSDSNIVYQRSCDKGVRSGLPFCLQYINALETRDGVGSIDFLSCYMPTAYQSDNVNLITNKYALTEGGYFRPRFGQYVLNESADAHVVHMAYTSSTTTNTIYLKKSGPAPGFQRVYFDNAMAPLINLRDMMDALFEFTI